MVIQLGMLKQLIMVKLTFHIKLILKFSQNEGNIFLNWTGLLKNEIMETKKNYV